MLDAAFNERNSKCKLDGSIGLVFYFCQDANILKHFSGPKIPILTLIDPVAP